MTIMLTLC